MTVITVVAPLSSDSKLKQLLALALQDQHINLPCRKFEEQLSRWNIRETDRTGMRTYSRSVWRTDNWQMIKQIQMSTIILQWLEWVKGVREESEKERMSRFLYHYYNSIALRPNIWGRVTDGPLFASHHSNVLPAPAPMSINGRHVLKHIQHTKRTLWLEEMDCPQDWRGTLCVCQSPKALCFTPCPKLWEQRRFLCLFLRDINTWLCCFTFGSGRKRDVLKKKKSSNKSRSL